MKKTLSTSSGRIWVGTVGVPQFSRLCTAAAPVLTELLTAVGWGVDKLPPEFPSKNSHLSDAGLLLSLHSRARSLEFHLISQNLLFLYRLAGRLPPAL